MAQNKVVGFTIEIKGQKEITTTTQVLGLMNTQLILINNTLKDIAKSSGANLGDLKKQFDSAGTSADKLGNTVKESFVDFKKGNKIVQNLGNGYFEVTKKVEKTAKEFKDLDKVIEGDSDSIKGLINRNKELKKVLETAPLAGTQAFEKQKDTLNKLGKEYTENNNAVKEFRKELRTGVKQSEVAEGSLDQLRKRAATLKKEYNALSGAQQNATFGQGAKVRKDLLATQKRIQKLDLAIKDGRTSVGLYANAQRGLGKVLLRLSVGRSIVEGVANGLRSMVGGLKNIAKESGGTDNVINNLNESGAKFISTLKRVGTSLLSTFGGTVAKIIDNVSFVIFTVGTALTEAGESGTFFGKIINTIVEILTNFPAIFGGIFSVVSNFKNTFVNSILEIKLNTELLIATVKKLGTALTGGDTANIEANINRINKALNDNVVFAKTIGEAYTEGYNSTIAAQKEFNETAIEQVAIDEKIAAQLKKSEEAKKKYAAAEKKRIEDLKKDREQILKDVEAETKARIKIVKDLAQELREIEILGIKDTTERALAEERNRFELERQQRNKAFDDTVNQIVSQEARLIALFGDNSEQLKQFRESSSNELLSIQRTSIQIAENLERAHQETLIRIKSDAAKTESDARTAAFNAEVAETQAEYEALEALEGQRSDALIAKQIETYKKEDELRKSRNQQTKDSVVGLVDSVFQGITAISNIAFEAENKRFQDAIDTRTQNIANLNEDLQNATGLQKKYLEIQVKNEQAALEEETKAKEKARREQAETQKAIAIVQAVIAAALGIANAFTLPPPASFIAAAATAVAAGAQIAVIASQKFAKGGLVGANNAANVGNGKITTSSNIATQSNGDNIFATVKRGEVILNEQQQRMLGGPSTFARINVPGFAGGGIIGAPKISSQPSAINDDFNKFVGAIMETTAATNNRIDNLSVNLDLNNLQDVEKNDNELNAMTTFDKWA